MPRPGPGLLGVLLAPGLLVACDAGEGADQATATASASASASLGTGASSGADASAGCRDVTDEQLSAWVGSRQEVVVARVSPVECQGVPLEPGDTTMVRWRLDDPSPGARLGIDRSNAPWFVVLRAATSGQIVEVTVRNDSMTEKVPVARLVEIARHVARAYR